MAWYGRCVLNHGAVGVVRLCLVRPGESFDHRLMTVLRRGPAPKLQHARTIRLVKATLRTAGMAWIRMHIYADAGFRLFVCRPLSATAQLLRPRIVVAKFTATTFVQLWQPHLSHEPSRRQNCCGGHICGVAHKGEEPNSLVSGSSFKYILLKMIMYYFCEVIFRNKL
jgi:hypothetical protein